MTSSFVMIFGALSNAAYRVSLCGPGAEIEGGSQPPPAGGGKSRGPAGRGDNIYSGFYDKSFFICFLKICVIVFFFCFKTLQIRDSSSVVI